MLLRIGICLLSTILFFGCASRTGQNGASSASSGRMEIDSRSTLKFTPANVTVSIDNCGSPGNMVFVLGEDDTKGAGLQISLRVVGAIPAVSKKYTMTKENPPPTQTSFSQDFEGDINLTISALKSQAGTPTIQTGVTRVDPQITTAEVTFLEFGDTVLIKLAIRFFNGKVLMATAGNKADKPEKACAYKVEKVLGYDEKDEKVPCWAQIGGTMCLIGHAFADKCVAQGGQAHYCSCSTRLCTQKVN